MYILHFIVQDTGIGISPEGQRRLFQSFSQVDASTTRKYGGTGLGLVISKRLAELMGGEMWLESTEGVGSKFHFTVKMPSAELPPSQNLLNVPQLNGKRLLIVDDNETSRRILTLQAQSWGMLAQVFGNPLDALASLEHGDAYDIGILDMHMPEMDGVTLATKIRANGLTLPLIMLTSLGWRDPSETVHFSAFLTKPVKQSVLYDAMIGVLALPDAQVRRNAHFESLFDPGMATRYPLRILLAEDNAVNQKLALRMLERFGYRADVAGNGLEVVQALERQPYDVVLMDVQMPEMDGLESTRQIRGTIAAEKQPRIIAMTANAMQGDREACLSAGMDDYIGKPINVKELSQALKDTFEHVGKPSGKLGL
jgi:CheY-like chemotaxis protein